jgi:hypothetical protein
MKLRNSRKEKRVNNHVQPVNSKKQVNNNIKMVSLITYKILMLFLRKDVQKLLNDKGHSLKN